MHRAASTDAIPTAAVNSAAISSEPASEQSAFIQKYHGRNFYALTVYQVVLRSGWIFKTESIIMPAVLDLISDGAPWARQMLPLLNRLGQSVPPMLMARRVKVSPLKSRTLLSTTLTMAGCFLLLGLLWLVMGSYRPWWMTLAFLACYGLFFAAMGVNQLVLSTTQGKLIAVHKRGRLLSLSNVVGSVAAITCALVLLPQWLHETTINVASIFGFASFCFFLSAVATLFLAEPPDHFEQASQTPWQHLIDAWRPIRQNANFRRLALVTGSYGVSLILFPHYQAVARQELGLSLEQLLWWLILQNAGVGLFSLVFGLVADRYGNRVVLNMLMLGLCGAPILSLLMSWYGHEMPWLYNFVFVLVGLTPVTIKTLHNYTLEICPPEEHPRALSSISLCMAAPLVVMLPLGQLLDRDRLDLLFIVSIVLILIGWILSFALREPRTKTLVPASLNEDL